MTTHRVVSREEWIDARRKHLAREKEFTRLRDELSRERRDLPWVKVAYPPSTLGMALGPWAGGWLYDAFGSYFWLYIGSFGIGLGAVAIALTFRPPRELPAVLPSPAAAH